MDWSRNKTAIGVALAAAAGVAGYFVARLLGRTEGSWAAALKGERPEGPVGYSGAARSAGAEAMRDPPRDWDRVDEASDESFPASDPSNLNPHVD
jgi:hypothetical protein